MSTTYLIKRNGLSFHIGSTHDLNATLALLQKDCPYKLTIIDTCFDSYGFLSNSICQTYSTSKEGNYFNLTKEDVVQIINSFAVVKLSLLNNEDELREAIPRPERSFSAHHRNELMSLLARRYTADQLSGLSF